MSFLSALGKIGGLALDFIPGGSAVKGGVKIAKGIAKGAEAAGAVSDVLGKQQAGAAKGAIDTAGVNQAQDRNAIDVYRTQQDAENKAADTDLERKKFTTSDRSANFKQALIAELLGHGGGGISLPGIPQVSGGLAELLQGAGAQSALSSFGGAAHAAQDAPASFAGGNMLTAPALTPLPQESGGGKLLDTIARIGQLSGAAAPFIPKKKPPMSETDGL